MILQTGAIPQFLHQPTRVPMQAKKKTIEVEQEKTFQEILMETTRNLNERVK